MDYMTITETAGKWGVSTRAVTYHVVSGRIEGAVKKGRMWLIPESTKRPEDLRKKKNVKKTDKNEKISSARQKALKE